MPTIRIACACLLVAGATAAQDYRVTAEKGTAYGCLQKSEAQAILDDIDYAENGDHPFWEYRFTALALVMERLGQLVQAKMCTVYQSDAVVTIVGEDEGDPEWVQVKEKDWLVSTREMWSRREWFEPVP